MKSTAKLLIVLILVASLFLTTSGQAARREINLPDFDGYKTLVCDFHTHSVFSDGSVWPTVRIDEAFNEGLDAIALTDHIEYRPHKDDIKADLNRSHDIAGGSARNKNILFPRGIEITRDTPPGHFNAIFLKDAEPLDTTDFMKQMELAKEQGAFVFWNHPNWKVKSHDEVYILDIHRKLRDEGLIQGIEIVNGSGYAEAAHAWALKHNLALIGNSDIHRPSMIGQSTAENHRTLTLVFARERTLESLRQALFDRRTAVWWDDKLIGKKDWLEGIFNNSIKISKSHNKWRDEVWVQIENSSDVTYQLEKSGGTGPDTLELPANETIILRTKIDKDTGKPDLRYKVTNLLEAPKKPLSVKLVAP